MIIQVVQHISVASILSPNCINSMVHYKINQMLSRIPCDYTTQMFHHFMVHQNNSAKFRT